MPVRPLSSTSRRARSRAPAASRDAMATATTEPRSKSTASRVARGASFLDGAIRVIALMTIFFVPLIVTPSTYESYRLPKEMVMRGAGIALLALPLIRVLLYCPCPRWRPDYKWLFCGLVILWSLVTVLTARNRILAMESMVWIVGCIVLFIALNTGFRDRWWMLIYTALSAAALNALY